MCKVVVQDYRVRVVQAMCIDGTRQQSGANNGAGLLSDAGSDDGWCKQCALQGDEGSGAEVQGDVGSVYSGTRLQGGAGSGTGLQGGANSGAGLQGGASSLQVDVGSVYSGT